MRQQCLSGQCRRAPPSTTCIHPRVQHVCRRSRTLDCVSQAGRLAVAAAAGAPAAGETAAAPATDKKPRGRPPARKKAPEEEHLEKGMPEIPTPLDYQQTLLKSFTMGGVGLHTGEYAWIRVRPAYAGEGRYFVRVPEGTNKHNFKFDAGNLEDQVPFDEAVEPQPEDEDLEDLRVEWFSVYLVAQEERGFTGTFRDYLKMQVELGELDDRRRKRILNIQDEEDDWQPTVEPDLSQEPEDILPLDPEDPSLVVASITSVSNVDLPFTQLGEGDNKVLNTELLLAALEACGVDNARIEIEGGHEIPVLDNSALGWCIEIQCAGMRPAPIRFSDQVPEDELPLLQRDVFMPSQAIAVQDEQGWIAFFPGLFANLTAGVDHTRVAPIIGSQWHTWHSDDVHFRYSLAPARAYAESVEQLFALRDAGFVQAGAENLFIIAHGDRWWDPDMVRMVYDEPVRYKLVQLIGNLSLMSVAGCQGIPVGHVTAFNASPSLQLAFVRTLVEAVKEEDVVNMTTVMEQQEAWLAGRSGPVVQRRGTSQGASDLGDGSAAEPVEAEILDDDEEV